MTKIILKQSSIVVKNYIMGMCPTLEEYFTQFDKVTKTFYFQGLYYDMNKQELILPRGMNVLLLERLLGCTATYDKHFDEFQVNNNLKIKYPPRNNVQREALRFLLGKEEYSNTANASQYCLNLDTGAGKTYIATMGVAVTGIKPIVITTNIEWINQWIERFQEYTNLIPQDIYFIKGSGSITRILKGIVDPSNFTVFVATHSTIKSYGDKYGWDKITEFFKMIKVGFKIYDEAHLNFDNICKIDFFTNTFKTLYLTATPARSDKHENFIYKIYFENVFAIDLFDEKNDPRTNYVGIHFKSKPTPIEIGRCHTMYGFSKNSYADYLLTKPNYYKMIHVILDICLKFSGKTLIYIGTNKAIVDTYNWLLENYPELAHDIGIYTSIVDKETKRSQLDKRIILSTTKSAGACSDIAGLQVVVCLAEPFNSKVLAKQTLGRCRERNTLYIEVVDDSFFEIMTYYNNKKDIFTRYALSCRDVSLVYNLDQEVDRILQARQPKKPLDIIYIRTDRN